MFYLLTANFTAKGKITPILASLQFFTIKLGMDRQKDRMDGRTGKASNAAAY